jgi:hypothetical protein
MKKLWLNFSGFSLGPGNTIFTLNTSQLKSSLTFKQETNKFKTTLVAFFLGQHTLQVCCLWNRLSVFLVYSFAVVCVSLKQFMQDRHQVCDVDVYNLRSVI